MAHLPKISTVVTPSLALEKDVFTITVCNLGPDPNNAILVKDFNKLWEKSDKSKHKRF